MPTARKLPSGAYRCQVFAGYVYENGEKKRQYESFTAATKEDAELLASQWNANKTTRPENITVLQAVKNYIVSRENVVSPSTIRGYNAYVDHFDMIADKKIRTISKADVQLWVSDLAATLSPKSVKNIFGLFSSSMGFYGIKCPETKLPAKIKPEYHLPTDEELNKVLAVSDNTLWMAIMLARYYSLREGEICALQSDDLKGNVLTIRRAMVHTTNNEWVIRDRPKTDYSSRSLIIAEPLLSRLQKCSGSIVGTNPNALGNRFRRAIARAGVPSFRFHDLRHAFATGAALAGVPDFYTAQMGGWNPASSVMKTIYQNVRQSEYYYQMDVLNGLMQHNLQHEMN